MKVNYKKTIEVNNQIKINVDEQQVNIKYLKERCNQDEKDKVQEISGAGTPMKKDKYWCVTCNKNVQRKKLVEKSYHGRAYDPV